MTTATEVAVQERIEREHIAMLRGWSGKVGEWTLRAAALRRERLALEEELSAGVEATIIALCNKGRLTLDEAEARTEALAEIAFRKPAE